VAELYPVREVVMARQTWIATTAKNVIIIPSPRLRLGWRDQLYKMSIAAALVALGLSKWDWRLVATLEALLLAPLWNWSFDGRWWKRVTHWRYWL
jgi:hypothetical protein